MGRSRGCTELKVCFVCAYLQAQHAFVSHLYGEIAERLAARVLSPYPSEGIDETALHPVHVWKVCISGKR
jgi:hypothetical protein